MISPLDGIQNCIIVPQIQTFFSIFYLERTSIRLIYGHTLFVGLDSISTDMEVGTAKGGKNDPIKRDKARKVKSKLHIVAALRNKNASSVV